MLHFTTCDLKLRNLFSAALTVETMKSGLEIQRQLKKYCKKTKAAIHSAEKSTKLADLKMNLLSPDPTLTLICKLWLIESWFSIT